jgi:CheY-like chemotaxis protein
MLAMSDTGVGMDAETQARIFEPFFTTKEKGKGTGLGLATVYGIVKQSGGYIWVYSEPGQGATFEIYLPQVEEGVEAVGPDKALAAPAPGSETILLVEDEAPVRKLARGFLESSGYTVLEAKDGVEAIQLAQQHSGPIHLMVTDVVMPQMSGDQLIERMAQLRPEMKVLCMSGYTDEALIHHGMLDQGISLLQKPFSLDVLARTVRKVLNARRNSLATSTEQATGIPR